MRLRNQRRAADTDHMSTDRQSPPRLDEQLAAKAWFDGHVHHVGAPVDLLLAVPFAAGLGRLRAAFHAFVWQATAPR